MSLVGISVRCAACGRVKVPHGRSVAPEMAEVCCTAHNCVGYDYDPKPGCLWPNESEDDLGFEACAHAAKESE